MIRVKPEHNLGHSGISGYSGETAESGYSGYSGQDGTPSGGGGDFLVMQVFS